MKWFSVFRKSPKYAEVNINATARSSSSTLAPLSWQRRLIGFLCTWRSSFKALSNSLVVQNANHGREAGEMMMMITESVILVEIWKFLANQTLRVWIWEMAHFQTCLKHYTTQVIKPQYKNSIKSLFKISTLWSWTKKIKSSSKRWSSSLQTLK